MDLQYGIAVNNKFSLFIDEDEDPLEILRQKEEEAKTKPKDDKKKAKSAKKAGASDIKPKQTEQIMTKKDEKPVSARGERGGGRGGRGRELRENDGTRPPRRQGPRDNRDGFSRGGDENVPPEFRERRDVDRRDRGEGGFERGRGRGFGRGGRGRGEGRGGRGRGEGRGGFSSDRGGFGAPGERRQFDRRSGDDRTGVKSVDKREGSGAHNWGSYRDDVEDQSQTENPANESGEFPPAEQTENADLNESGEAPKEDDEAKEMTLDEWKAMQDKSRMKQSFNLRKAGEGVDDKQWKKGVAYKKKPEEEDEESEEEEDDDEDRHGTKKQLVTDIRITFADNPRRGGRGGRGRGEGRGRGGRGRGEGRGGFGGERQEERRPERRGPRESAPRIENEEEFPSLGK